MQHTLYLDQGIGHGATTNTNSQDAAPRRETRHRHPNIQVKAQRRGWHWLMGYKVCEPVDISCGGVGISCPELRLGPAQLVDLLLTIDGQGFKATGYVCETSRIGNRRCFNIAFLQAPDDMINIIRDHYVETEALTQPSYRTSRAQPARQTA